MAATLGLFKHLVKQLGYSPRQLQQQIHQCSTGSSGHLVLCSPSRWWKLVRQGEHPMCFSVPNTPYGQVILFSSSHNCSPRFQYQLSSWESGPEPILVRKPFWYLAHSYLCAISQLQWTFCVDSASLQRTSFWQDLPSPSGAHLYEVERHPQPVELWVPFVLTLFQPANNLMSHRNILKLVWKAMKLCHLKLFQYWICVTLLCLSFEIWLFLI